MPVITVELPEQEIERLTIEAERRNMTLPELVAERVKANGNGANDRSRLDPAFRESVARVIHEDLELLKRLA